MLIEENIKHSLGNYVYQIKSDGKKKKIKNNTRYKKNSFKKVGPWQM